MYFDWITWSIWLIGFLVMVIWVFVPIKEFKILLEKRKKYQLSKNKTSVENAEVTQINEIN